MRWLKLSEKISFIFLLLSLALAARKFVFQLGSTSFQFESVFLEISELAAVLFVAAGLANWFSGRRRPVTPRLTALLLSSLFFLSWTAASALNADLIALSLIKTLELALAVLVFLTLALRGLPISWPALAGIFVGAAVLETALSFGQIWRQSSLGVRLLGEPLLSGTLAGVAKIAAKDYLWLRAYGTFLHPNVMGAFLMVAFALAAVVWLEAKGRLNRRLVLFSGMLALLAGLLMGSSRIAASGLIIFMLIFNLSVVAIGHLRRLYLSKLIRFDLLAGMALAVFAAVLWPMIGYHWLPAGQDQAISLRGIYQSSALRMAREEPLRGRGLGGFVGELKSQEYFSGQLAQKPWLAQPVHNLYLLLAVETGVIGLALFLLLTGLVVLPLVYNFSQQPDLKKAGLLAVIFSLLAMAGFDHFFLTQAQGRILWWLIMGLGASAVSSSLSRSYHDPRHELSPVYPHRPASSKNVFTRRS